MCRIDKDDIHGRIGINQEELNQLFKESTFVNGVCQQEVCFYRLNGKVGVCVVGGERYKEFHQKNDKDNEKDMLELVCKVYNINEGHNKELLDKCKWLSDYMVFIDKVREYHKNHDDEELHQDIEKAIDYCIKNNILKDFLKERRTEVLDMTAVDYTYERRMILNYNEGKEENKQITYTDYIGLMMSSISTIINAISYVLIGFVSISLVVSSIMIGIITYISVLERTKEIGVLRAIGASKKDISRVFNAEAFLVGLVSGVLGIVITLGIDAIINIILYALVGLQIAKLPVLGAFILIGISVLLSLIAGLIPSGFAAKRDPVIALRSE